MNKLQGQYTSGPCSVSQKAAEAAYTGTQAPVEEMRKAFERRRDLIVKLAKEIPGFEVNFPQGAFYLFPKCDSFFGKKDGDRVINNADDLAMYLLEVGHVACVGGTSFGAPECIRMSYATSDGILFLLISPPLSVCQTLIAVFYCFPFLNSLGDMPQHLLKNLQKAAWSEKESSSATFCIE